MTAIRLPPAQEETLRQALADAVFYRDPPLHCADCETLGDLCRRCTVSLSRARAYLALSHELDSSRSARSNCTRSGELLPDLVEP
jgi:hypothetical protein